MIFLYVKKYLYEKKFSFAKKMVDQEGLFMKEVGLDINLEVPDDLVRT